MGGAPFGNPYKIQRITSFTHPIYMAVSFELLTELLTMARPAPPYGAPPIS